LVGTLFAIDRLFQGAVWSELAMKVLLGGAVYLFSIYLIDRSILHNVYRMVVSKKMDAEA
jgi:hypothetical protein